MEQIIRSIYDQLSQNTDIALVTITAATGATPRGAGARMLVNSRGRICGTIGGGAVEFRAIEIAKEVLNTKISCRHNFSLTRSDIQDLGMICGGNVEVFFHYLPSSDPSVLSFSIKAKERFSSQEDLWLLSDLSEGGDLNLYGRNDAPTWLLPYLIRKPSRFTRAGHDLFLEQISSSGRVYIFGGGHVAQALVPVLSNVGFRCIVMDDRPEFTTPSLFHGAQDVLSVDFTRISDFVSLNEDDYACVMTRGHAYDTLIQAQLLRMHPCYIGVIGSASKAAGVRKSLIEDYGFTNQDVDRITTPIGLKIGAETPEEIAISIAAQMISVRAALNKQ